MIEQARIYLPDHLSQRTVEVLSDEVISHDGWDGDVNSHFVTLEGVGTAHVAEIRHASFADLVRLRQRGLDFTARPDSDESEASWMESLARMLESKMGPDGFAVVLPSDASANQDTQELLQGAATFADSKFDFSVRLIDSGEGFELPAGSYVLGQHYFGVK